MVFFDDTRRKRLTVKRRAVPYTDGKQEQKVHVGPEFRVVQNEHGREQSHDRVNRLTSLYARKTSGVSFHLEGMSPDREREQGRKRYHECSFFVTFGHFCGDFANQAFLVVDHVCETRRAALLDLVRAQLDHKVVVRDLPERVFFFFFHKKVRFIKEEEWGETKHASGSTLIYARTETETKRDREFDSQTDIDISIAFHVSR